MEGGYGGGRVTREKEGYRVRYEGRFTFQSITKTIPPPTINMYTHIRMLNLAWRELSRSNVFLNFSTLSACRGLVGDEVGNRE